MDKASVSGAFLRLHKRKEQMAKTKIGILGGSFNPPHLGHVHLAETAQKQLALKQVWFMVSPQNPHKKPEGMASFEERVRLTEMTVFDKSFIKVSTFESKIGNTYTYKTLKSLEKAYPMYEFIWLMGADNLKNFHKWQNSDRILQEFSVVVFDRAEPQRQSLLKSPALQRIKNSRNPFKQLTTKAKWMYLFIPIHSGRATDLRKSFKNGQYNAALHPNVISYLQQNEAGFLAHWHVN